MFCNALKKEETKETQKGKADSKGKGEDCSKEQLSHVDNTKLEMQQRLWKMMFYVSEQTALNILYYYDNKALPV